MTRPRALPIVLLAAVLAVPVRADSPACLWGFANVAADSAEGTELVAIAYAQLLDRVGGASFTQDVLRRLVDSKKPFEIPDDAGKDLGSLKRKMQEFESMVRAKGWNTPATIERLLSDLEARQHGVETAAEKLSVAQGRSGWRDHPIWINPDGLLVSPDGRYLISTDKQRVGSGTQSLVRVRVYDRETKRLVNGGAETRQAPAAFTPDGTALLFPEHEGPVVRVPFKDGKLDWTARTSFGTVRPQHPAGHQVLVGCDPNVVYAGPHTNYLYRYDLRDNSTVEIIPADYFGWKSWLLRSDERVIRFGMIPGTDRLSLIVFEGRKDRVSLHTVEVDARGKMKQIEKRGPWNAGSGDIGEIQVNWLKNGTTAISWGGVLDGVSLTDTGQPLPQPLLKHHHTVHGVAVHPGERELAVLVEENGDRRVETYDLHTKEQLGRFPVGRSSTRLRFLPDGETLLLDVDNHVRAINWRGRANY